MRAITARATARRGSSSSSRYVERRRQGTRPLVRQVRTAVGLQSARADLTSLQMFAATVARDAGRKIFSQQEIPQADDRRCRDANAKDNSVARSPVGPRLFLAEQKTFRRER